MFCGDSITRLAEAILKLTLLIKNMEAKLAYDFTKLDTAQTDTVAKLEALVASVAALAAQLAAVQTTDPAVQAHIDNVAAALEAEVAKATPPAPAPGS